MLKYRFPIASIADILHIKAAESKSVKVSGWVRTSRIQKHVAFAEITDGSLNSLQAVFNDVSLMQSITTGCSVELQGTMMQAPTGSHQTMELHVQHCKVIGKADPEDNPLSKSRLPLEYLREIPHLRTRSRCFESAWRVRNRASSALHEFLQKHQFNQIFTPIITSSDCEGAGEQFTVSSFNRGGKNQDFFNIGSNNGKEGGPFLTVSGQLHLEATLAPLSRIYTFSPTFRAEPSKTTRHLAEFWMLEAEIAFIPSLPPLLEFIEALIRHTVRRVIVKNAIDVETLARVNGDVKLVERLNGMAFDSTPFARITYTEAIGILKPRNSKWTHPVTWGCPLSSEHERYLADEYIVGPVFVTDYPKAMKPFYMRVNDIKDADAEGDTVACVDLLIPGVGELVGGSVREERFDHLYAALCQNHMDPLNYAWYLDQRRIGSVPHSGFGMGFERLLRLVSGFSNIRDTIPFPRYQGHCAQ